ncbi:MAG: T9SS type A sorting domain-containing protein [Chitinophagales bacterium]|nr:T9SS type A sorting domain-containing protein [Chitinophagales bacterium]
MHLWQHSVILEKKFKDEIDTNASIDKNNVFIAGISAGAFLTIYSVFLDQAEIPTSLSYSDCDNNTTTINTASLKTQWYPIPKIKGIIPMAGGSFYNNIFNYTSHSASVAINLMHGTCDELINQNEGRVIYKFLIPTAYNENTASRYPHAYGSKYIYNTLLTTNHQRTGFGQVLKGGHNVIGSQSSVLNGWDIYNTVGSAISLRDPVFDNISSFMKRVLGEAGYPAWTNHAYSIFPDVPTSLCLTDDQTLINPPIITYDTICKDINMAASLVNPPSWATINWNVSSNLQIIGSNTGTSVTYKANGSGNGILTATVTYGGATMVIHKSIFVLNLAPLFPTPVASPIDYNVICGANKTLTLTNLPSSYDSINWTASGNVSIESSSGTSVTYKRTNNSAGSGILSATIVTACETKTFPFTITTYSTLQGHAIGIISSCETGLVEMTPTKLVPGSTVTFTTLFPNAANHGITAGDWEFECGTTIGTPTHYWIGTTLRSQITVLVGSSGSSCSYVRVRPVMVCGSSVWKTQETVLAACSGGGGWSLMSYPNPTSDELYVSMSHSDEKLINQKYTLEIVDITGNVVSRLYIEGGKQQIRTNDLQPGHYKVLVHTEQGIITDSFIIKK